jgi:hypothetical protein
MIPGFRPQIWNNRFRIHHKHGVIAASGRSRSPGLSGTFPGRNKAEAFVIVQLKSGVVRLSHKLFFDTARER